LPDNAALRLAHDPLTRRDLRWQIDAGRVTLLRTATGALSTWPDASMVQGPGAARDPVLAHYHSYHCSDLHVPHRGGDLAEQTESFLPLPPQHFHVLLALGARGVLHGYGIIQSYEALTGGRDTLLPGSLYASLARMAEIGLIGEVTAPAGEASGGPRRKYYRATALGRRVARAETLRQSRLVELARLRGLAPSETTR
jgi:DNA-binding PadR family transcriptional regulator